MTSGTFENPPEQQNFMDSFLTNKNVDSVLRVVDKGICMQIPTNRDPFSVAGTMFNIEGVEGGISDFA